LGLFIFSPSSPSSIIRNMATATGYEKVPKINSEDVVVEMTPPSSPNKKQSNLQRAIASSRAAEKVVIEWNNLSFSTLTGKKNDYKEKKILRSVSGFAESGQLVAIMGPTGDNLPSYNIISYLISHYFILYLKVVVKLVY